MTNSTSVDRESVLEPLIRKLSYRTRLVERDRAAIRALPHTVKSMEPHQYVVREGDRASPDEIKADPEIVAAAALDVYQADVMSSPGA
mgnify:CR=1 FL=1